MLSSRGQDTKIWYMLSGKTRGWKEIILISRKERKQTGERPQRNVLLQPPKQSYHAIIIDKALQVNGFLISGVYNSPKKVIFHPQFLLEFSQLVYFIRSMSHLLYPAWDWAFCCHIHVNLSLVYFCFHGWAHTIWYRVTAFVHIA